MAILPHLFPFGREYDGIVGAYGSHYIKMPHSLCTSICTPLWLAGWLAGLTNVAKTSLTKRGLPPRLIGYGIPQFL